jgi:hypothetical protein
MKGFRPGLLLVLALVLHAGGTRAEQDAMRKVADAMAQSGTATVAQGNIEKGKDFFYKALALNEDCPEALYELGKLFEKENKPVAAGDFYVRAVRLMAQEEKAGSPFVAKRADAERRIKGLNPFAPRFEALMEDYAQELGKIAKRTPDTLTREEAQDHVSKLQLASILSPDKLPKIEPVAKAAPKDKEKDIEKVIDKEKEEDSSSPAGRGRFRTVEPVEPETVLPPEVELALKKAGWNKITGKWVKKAANVYEVTDGRLEAQKTNSAIDVALLKGLSGVVKVSVRNSAIRHFYSYHSDYLDIRGYGFAIKDNTYRLVTPMATGNFNSDFLPYVERELPLPEANPKNQITVMIQDTKIQYSLNGAIIKNMNYKISKDGPFLIEIEGTATIENPRCMGQ